MEKKQLSKALAGLTDEQHAELAATAQKTLGMQPVGPKYFIPEEKVDDVGHFILTTQKKYPTMCKDRVMRKAAEYFKLKRVSPSN